MRKLMEIWVDEERGFLSVTQHNRQYRFFGGYQEDPGEECFTIGDTKDAVNFMLRFFKGLNLKIGSMKIKEDSFHPVIESYLELKEKK